MKFQEFYIFAGSRMHTVTRTLLSLALILCFAHANAQPPTSLQYPSPNAFLANATTVYIAPTISGSGTGLGYGIAPTLPAGLTFNTTTGVISGMPTVVSPATVYTVTATNPSGSTTANLTITVTSSFYNNANAPLSFSTDTLRKIGNGTNVGDIILFRNVTNISGQAIDCIVKTTRFTAGTTFTSYDQPNATGGGFDSNDPKFFSPQVSFPAGGGDITFDFQFIAGGTYNDATQAGTNVTLQNVKLNTYDIDGNGNANSNQYNEFSGFDTSELGSATTIKSPVYNSATLESKYESNIATNSPTITADPTRVRLTYKDMSTFTIIVGAGANGAAFFFLDFSSGPAFTTAIKVTPPTLDLNTDLPGTGNGATGCASNLSFTAPSQTNAASGTAINELTVRYKYSAALFPDGASERLVINGATAGTSSFPLNFATGATANVTVGGINYTVTSSISGNLRTFSFVNGATTFTLANAEVLLDALAYADIAAAPVAGDRSFTVNFRNTQFLSPDAVFTASIKCVSISGNIYHDANGLKDNLVNATGATMGQFAAGQVYAVLTNSSNLVLAVVPIAAGGAYNFGRADAGKYNILVSATTQTVGSAFTTPTYPTGGYKPTGENLGAAAGSDGLIDGKLSITLGTVAVTNANFGVQIPPVTTDYTFGNQPNPGGFNFYTIPVVGFTGTDADGTVDSLVITSFPTGANYLKIGTTYYTSTGSTCPPQTTCTAWPGTVRLPYSAVGTIAVDPLSAGNTSVVLSYKVIDNGNFESNNGTPSTITIPFVVPATPISITGNVWNDINGNGIKEATEPFSNAANSGQTLYAILVQTTNTYSGAATILTSTPVSATTGYTFSNVPSGNNYEVRIGTLATAPVDGAALTTFTQVLASGYTGVSTSNNGTIVSNLNTQTLNIGLGTVTASQVNVNFGIEQPPTAGAGANSAVNPGGAIQVTVPANTFTNTTVSSDPTPGTVTGIRITAFPTGATSIVINGVTYTSANVAALTALIIPTDASGNPTYTITVDPTASGATSVSIPFVARDAAGIESAANGTAVLNLTTLSISGIVYNDSNGLLGTPVNTIDGTPTNIAGALYAHLLDNGGTDIARVAVAANGTFSFTGLNPATYSVVINTTATASTAAALPANWVNTGEFNGAGAGNDGTANGILPSLVLTTTDITTAKFGLDRLPDTDPKSQVIPQPAANSIAAGIITQNVSGSDPEDGVLGNSGTIVITTLPANATMVYNGAAVTLNQVITGFNPALVSFTNIAGGSTSVAFQYAFRDAAGKQDPTPAAYTISWTGVLPVLLQSFTVADNGNCAVIFSWKTATESNLGSFIIEQSANGIDFASKATVSPSNNAAGKSYSLSQNQDRPGITYYRLKIVGADGTITYSSVVKFSSDCNKVVITVSPNPVRDIVKVSGVQNGNTITVISNTGAKLQTKKVSSTTEMLNLSSYAQGIYLIIVTDESGNILERTKLIKD